MTLRVRWALEQTRRALGLPGAVAAALLAVAAALHWGASADALDRARALDRQSATLERRLANMSAAPRDLSASEQLAALERRFGTDADVTSALSTLEATARKRGITLQQAEFKLVHEPSEPFARYVMQLPVKTDYRSLRRFIRDAMRALPGLSMEEVSLRRTDPRSTQLEAQLRLVLFLRKG